MTNQRFIKQKLINQLDSNNQITKGIDNFAFILL